NVRLPGGLDGFGAWHTDEHGVPFHEMRDFASLFFVPGAAEVEIPIRVEKKPPRPVPVSIGLAAVQSLQVAVSEQWLSTIVRLPEGDPLLLHQRINLALDPAPGRDASSQYPPVYVGQPRIVSTR